jgi:hypothetical protein
VSVIVWYTEAHIFGGICFFLLQGRNVSVTCKALVIKARGIRTVAFGKLIGFKGGMG